MRVVPVGAGIGHADLVGEGLADGDRRLRLVCAVVAILEPQPVPVHGRGNVPVIGHVNGECRILRQLQRRPRDGAVVGQHSHGGVPDLLLHRRDLEVELVSVRKLDDL